jgi:hypothetical protein
MDPQACLNELFRVVLLLDADPDEARELLTNLVEWHEKGGFLPDLKVALDTVLQRRREMTR